MTANFPLRISDEKLKEIISGIVKEIVDKDMAEQDIDSKISKMVEDKISEYKSAAEENSPPPKEILVFPKLVEKTMEIELTPENTVYEVGKEVMSGLKRMSINGIYVKDFSQMTETEFELHFTVDQPCIAVLEYLVEVKE